MEAIFHEDFGGFCFQKSSPEPLKIIKFYSKNKIVWLLGFFNIRSLSDAILVSTWFHFSPEKHLKTRLGSPLGRLGRVLGRLGGILGRLRMVLESSWAVFGRLVGLVGLLVGILRLLVAVLGRLGDLHVCKNSSGRVPGGGSAGASY